MTELLTAAQMRAIEQAAIASGEVTGLELMERAGAGVVEAILEEWPDMALTAQKAVVLCGPGNNGGDGFVVARLLKQRGWAVEVFLYGEVAKLPPDAKVNAERWLEIGEIAKLSPKAVDRKTHSGAVFIDAIFGTGLTRPLEGAAHDAMRRLAFLKGMPVMRKALIAIDAPSGLCLDSGRPIVKAAGAAGYYVPYANLTVAFQSPKIGHVVSDGSVHCKKLVIIDIGLEKIAKKHARGNLGTGAYIPQKANSYANLFSIKESLMTELRKSGFGVFEHKYHHGHALILSGPSAHTGAARLAARGALRIGAGVVSLGAPQSAIPECAAQLTAIMLAPIEDGVALEATLQDKRINALCLGPALGLDERAEGLLEAAIGGVEPHPTVLDADALTILARNPDLFAKLHKNCVLTPHAGEFKRLFPDIMTKLDAPATKGPAYSKVDATREAAAVAGCVVLFKGADTVIAAPDGRAAINSAHYERAAPWLATAGSGDVLAGFITGLLARGFAPMQAAETAAWLHVECALQFGPGLIAEDLPEQLPAVFKALGL